ncbi:MAG: hypothetical protein LBE08_07220, partial [Bifidobacteriaceae bacterium]|nr:hypothetical protein [Bifidobacteriaceae bacterium]
MKRRGLIRRAVLGGGRPGREPGLEPEVGGEPGREADGGRGPGREPEGGRASRGGCGPGGGGEPGRDADGGRASRGGCGPGGGAGAAGEGAPQGVRRWLVWLVVGVAVAVPAAFAGVVTARVSHPFGPHEAVYEVRLSSLLEVDLGPFGTAEMATGLPGPLGYFGARVSVGAIPADSTAVPLVDLTNFDPAQFARELERYGQAYLGIETTVRHAALRLAANAAIRTGIFWAAGVTALAVLSLALGRARRNQVRYYAVRHRLVAAGVVVGVMIAGAGSTWAYAAWRRPGDLGRGDPLLAGTPFASARLTGRLGQLVSEYGQVALAAYRDTEAFYAEAAASVEAVFAEQAALAAQRAGTAAGPGGLGLG